MPKEREGVEKQSNIKFSNVLLLEREGRGEGRVNSGLGRKMAA